MGYARCGSWCLTLTQHDCRDEDCMTSSCTSAAKPGHRSTRRTAPQPGDFAQHNKLREADLEVKDRLTDDAYKGQKSEWWFSQGCKYCDRLIGKFFVASRDVLTPEMMTGIAQ